MKRNFKITITALSVMLIMALAVTVLSFSLADESDQNGVSNEPALVAAGGVEDYTIIDNIILNSNSTVEGIDTQYHIVEIGSGTGASSLQEFVTTNGFEQYVIEGNRTIEDLMKDGSITYQFYSASSVTDDSTEALADISKADFIYVSNDASKEFAKNNDICEELVNLLRTYAVGNYKPLVIDKPKATSIQGTTTTSATVQDLVNNEYVPNEMVYYTFGWDTNISSEDFLQHKNGSLYLGINGQRAKDAGKWTQLVKKSEAEAKEAAGEAVPTYQMAKILVITNDGSMENALALVEGDTNNVHGIRVDLTAQDNDLAYSDGTLVEDTDGAIYDIETMFFQTYAYNSRYVSPEYVKLYSKTLADVAADTVMLEDYDMIIMDDSIASSTVSNDLYKKLAAAMVGKINIVYPKSMATSSGGGGSADVPDDYKETNYHELFYAVATTELEARYENIMVTTRSSFDVITTSTNAQTAKVIADLINKSAFRGIGGQGSGSSSSKFTVLEIQPCYPIDEALAVEIGQTNPRSSENSYNAIYGNNNYYTSPADMINGKTQEQIPAGTEYYAWELSKAKIADALNMDVNQINLVQMSTEELAASKTEILGTYDLIYVGGNTSALKHLEGYKSLVGLDNAYKSLGNAGASFNVNRLNELPIYTMYTHSGDMVAVSTDTIGESGGMVKNGTAMANVVINGATQSSFALMNGNDITYDMYVELSKYAAAGMPVIVSDDAATGYQAYLDFNYLQNSIDPDSNMRKFLTDCYALKDKNVLWDFDKDAVVYVDNDGGRLGDTLTGYVEVFADDSGSASIFDNIYTTNIDETTVPVTGMKDDILDLYTSENTKHRPKMTLTNMPATYNQYDESTKLTDGTLKFNYRITGGGKYTVSLYIDDDSNSKFDRTAELMTSGTEESLTCTLSEDYFGPVYWLIEAKDTTTGLTTSTTGIAYVKNKTDEKQTVRVLQLMPGAAVTESWQKPAGAGADGTSATNSLYFCTVCQQTYSKLNYNPISNSGQRFTFNARYSANYYEAANGMVGNRNLGKHEHTFGIVKYDSNAPIIDGYSNGKTYKKDSAGNIKYGMDDWETNLADEVSNLYDFDLDIMLRGEYEQIAKDVHDAYDFSSWSDAQKNTIVSSFTLSETDSEKAYYDALTETDDKLEFIMQRRYEEAANKYYELYTYMKEGTAIEANATDEVEYEIKHNLTYDVMTNVWTEGTAITATTYDKKKQIDAVIDDMIAHVPTVNGGFNLTDEDLIAELQWIKQNHYSDMYSIDSQSMVYNDNSLNYITADANGNKKGYNACFDEYVVAKDLELTYRELYKQYSYYASGSNWLLDNYDTVILGPSEDFGGDDFGKDANLGVYGLTDLETYVAGGGNTILFHDTLTKLADAGTANLTKRLRGYFGLDRYHMVADDSASANTYFVPYTTTKSSDKYFMTDIYPTNQTASRYTDWYNEMLTIHNATGKRYLTNVIYTDAIYGASKSTVPCSFPYKYAEMCMSYSSFYFSSASQDTRDNDQFGTNHASQNNKGIVTLFPFTLSDELNIAGTHSQAYALDLENSNATVWYSLAGGNNQKKGSSMYAASPRDGMDSYFIYTYENVNYCGAGHSKITGPGRDNNDERRLYINIICNSVKKSVMQPDIFIYDFGKDTYGDKVTKDGAGYKIKVDSTEDYPEFSFKVTIDDEATIKGVNVYYDLDYLTNKSDVFGDPEFHKMIVSWTSQAVEAGKRKDVYRYDPDLIELEGVTDLYPDGTSQPATMLKLRPEYFDNYNGEYTYIVIEVISVVDGKEQKSYKRIKIQLKANLFNLT